MRPAGAAGGALVYKGLWKIDPVGKYEFRVRAFAMSMRNEPEAYRYSDKNEHLSYPPEVIYSKEATSPCFTSRATDVQFYQPSGRAGRTNSEEIAEGPPVVYPAGSIITTTSWPQWFIVKGPAFRLITASNFPSGNRMVLFVKGMLPDGTRFGGLLQASDADQATALRKEMSQRIQDLGGIVTKVVVQRFNRTATLGNMDDIDMDRLFQVFRDHAFRITTVTDLTFNVETEHVDEDHPRPLNTYPAGERHERWSWGQRIGMPLRIAVVAMVLHMSGMGSSHIHAAGILDSFSGSPVLEIGLGAGIFFKMLMAAGMGDGLLALIERKLRTLPNVFTPLDRGILKFRRESGKNQNGTVLLLKEPIVDEQGRVIPAEDVQRVRLEIAGRSETVEAQTIQPGVPLWACFVPEILAPPGSPLRFKFRIDLKPPSKKPLYSTGGYDPAVVNAGDPYPLFNYNHVRLLESDRGESERTLYKRNPSLSWGDVLNMGIGEASWFFGNLAGQVMLAVRTLANTQAHSQEDIDQFLNAMVLQPMELMRLSSAAGPGGLIELAARRRLADDLEIYAGRFPTQVRKIDSAGDIRVFQVSVAGQDHRIALDIQPPAPLPLPPVQWWKDPSARAIMILPLAETNDGDPSPYAGTSLFAGDALHYVDPSRVPDLPPGALEAPDVVRQLAHLRAQKNIDYEAVRRLNRQLLQLAFKTFFDRGDYKPGTVRGDAFHAYEALLEQRGLLQDIKNYAAFHALLDEFGGKPWWEWPLPYQNFDSHEVQAFLQSHHERILYYEYLQWIFFEQSMDARRYAREKKTFLIGDLPMYPAPNSAEVWRYKDKLFDLHRTAGAPKDSFSETGQNWGNHPYRWMDHEDDVMELWLRRIRYAALFFDGVRIDHLLGFFGEWNIPLHEPAIRGKSIPESDEEMSALGERITRRLTLEAEKYHLWVIGEDLGERNDPVRQAIDDVADTIPILWLYNVLGWRKPNFAQKQNVLWVEANHDTDATFYDRLRNVTDFTDAKLISLAELLEAMGEVTVPAMIRDLLDFEINRRAFLGQPLTPVESEQADGFLRHWATHLPSFSFPGVAKAIEMASLRVTVEAGHFFTITPQSLFGWSGLEHRVNRPSTVGGNWKWLTPRPVEAWDLLNSAVALPSGGYALLIPLFSALREEGRGIGDLTSLIKLIDFISNLPSTHRHEQHGHADLAKAA